MGKGQGKKSGGAKKYGRNLAKCSVYKSQGRREKNKVRRFKSFLKRTKQFEILEKIKDLKFWEIIRKKTMTKNRKREVSEGK